MKKLNFLLVEDNLADVRITKEMFIDAKIQYNLNVVEDGIKALAYLSKQAEYRQVTSPDVLLLDINLPFFNGVDILRFMKNEGITPKVYVFISSEYDKEKLSYYKEMISDYIYKPLEGEMIAKIYSDFIKEGIVSNR